MSVKVEIGGAMVGQQYRIKEMRLVEEYNQNRLFGSQAS